MNIQLDPRIVLETLTRAASQNTEILKPAEEQLSKWEIEKNFYSILMEIVSNHAIEVNVRWQAVIYFKNGIDRYWRRTAPNSIAEEEKINLRRYLIAQFNEPVNQIATQLAVLISKIARYDCPHEWPELMPTLIEAVKAEQDLLQHRALLTLRHVTKSLSSKCLPGDRRIFQELSNTILPFILNIWNSHTESFLHGERNPTMSLEMAVISLKILRELLIHGIKEPHKVTDAVLFLNAIFERLKLMLECRLQLIANVQLRELCERYIILLTEVLLDVLEHHPFSYVQFLRPSLEFTVQYLFTNEGKEKLFEGFTILCLNLIRGIVKCAEYKVGKISEGAKDPATLEAHKIKSHFLTDPTLIEICRQLISYYFLLTEEDLAAWENDPEGIAADEGGEAWKFNLRPCTEKLFVSIFHEYRNTLIPIVLELIRENVTPCDPSNLQSVLFKDAIYNAVGLAAFDLFDDVDFDQWFYNILRKELEIKDVRYKIIRRRVIQLIGRWISVKLAYELRPILYETILRLLSKDEDLVVRLEAAATLKIAVDDFEFNTDQFLPFLQSSFSLLFQLLQQVSEGDSKMHVLHVLSFVIERVRVSIQPYADTLIQYLPLLWNESEDHNMLRCAILTTLVHLIEGLGPASEKLYPFLIPVIQLSTDIQQPPSVYLMEDGLELWRATLENATRMQNIFLQLCPNVISLLETTSENLKTCLQILQMYVLLGPREFLQNFASSVVSVCCSLVTDSRAEALVMIMKLVEIVLRALPVEGVQAFQPLFSFVFKTVMLGQEYTSVMSMFISIIARILINDQNCFQLVLENVSRDLGKTPETALGKLLDVWIEKNLLVTQLERRKLLGLAVGSLLTWPTSVITDRFCGLLLVIVEVLNDVIRADDNGAPLDTLILSPNDPQTDDVIEEEYETEHERRKKLIAFKDPVHTVVLKDYVQNQLIQLQQRIGPHEFQSLMQTVDVETMQQLQVYLNVN